MKTVPSHDMTDVPVQWYDSMTAPSLRTHNAHSATHSSSETADQNVNVRGTRRCIGWDDTAPAATISVRSLQCLPMAEGYDAVVIGSGPNGLAAAITLARAGKSVLVREGNDTLGGSCRSAALTLPGFVHDVCSTVQALAVASPFMRSVPLGEYGLELVHPDAPYAQPMDHGPAAVAERSIDATAATLGVDADAYRRLMNPFLRDWEK